ncbi:MAG: aminoglycoside phosphotransferase family protein [Oscillospiraceae bacterium]|jgi:tRNA A-37 threonylcarbamoyl transferase component Bud32|nr:aminoglycoside phosphotransferase family protein [Oscillospiraceae bacterium]
MSIKRCKIELKTPIAEGNTADIYLHNGKIIKLFKSFLPDLEAENEASKQIFAYSKSLSVPRVYEVSIINGKQAIIMEYVKGKTIGSIILNDRTKAEQYMNLSVDIQLKIHALKADNFVLMTDKLKSQLHNAVGISEKQKAALIDKLGSMKYENRLCHGDYHVNNLILSETGVFIIDWVDSCAGDIKADVYRSYLLYSQYSTELANLYLRLYCERSGLSQKDVFKWEPIIAGARLSENVASEKASGNYSG